MSVPPPVTLAIPCRVDEPALGRTLAAGAEAWRRAPDSATGALEVLVCLNGGDASGPLREMRAFAERAGAPLAEIDVDRGESMPALILANKSQAVLFYDLTTPPPVLRTEAPGAIPTRDGSNWRHASVIGSYNDAELDSILAYVRVALRP